MRENASWENPQKLPKLKKMQPPSNYYPTPLQSRDLPPRAPPIDAEGGNGGPGGQVTRLQGGGVY